MDFFLCSSLSFLAHIKLRVHTHCSFGPRSVRAASLHLFQSSIPFLIPANFGDPIPSLSLLRPSPPFSLPKIVSWRGACRLSPLAWSIRGRGEGVANGMRVGGGAAGIFGFWLIKKSFFTKKWVFVCPRCFFCWSNHGPVSKTRSCGCFWRKVRVLRVYDFSSWVSSPIVLRF